ncbi:MAG: zinc ribbon domain-containing protein [bacterium]|nr:zinc ribbon domain-containing protein [bacterium]
MPHYEYECSKCGKSFETFQSITEAPLTDCPDETCGGKGTVRRLISRGAGVIFKGSGFYQTDYKRNGSAGTKSGKSESSEPTTKPCACGANGTCPLESK